MSSNLSTMNAMLQQAEAAGRQAYAENASRAPYAHPKVAELCNRLPVDGATRQGGSIRIYQAFTRGFDLAADEAAAAVLADAT